MVLAGIGLLGTSVERTAGGLITQRQSDRRERERWVRKDALWTFEQRCDAYIDFYESLREMAVIAYDHGMGLSEPPRVWPGFGRH